MALRVAFDLDGTLADMHVALRSEVERLFGAWPPGHGDASDTQQPARNAPESSKVMAEMRLTTRQQTQLWDHVKTLENFWVGLPEVEPGAVARVAETAASRRWEVMFLTTRPLVAGDTVQIQSQRWLEAHGFPLPSVFVVQRSRGKIADVLDLDAVVDDRPENCLDVSLDSQAKPILVWRSTRKVVPPGPGVRVTTSIAEALDVLIKLDELKTERGVVGSIKKFFGKATPV